MFDVPHARVRYLRKLRALEAALEKLREVGVILSPEYRLCKERTAELQARWREELARCRPPGARPRGRPRKEDRPGLPGTCKFLHGCTAQKKAGFDYCKAEHAPLGLYGLADDEDTDE